LTHSVYLPIYLHALSNEYLHTYMHMLTPRHTPKLNSTKLESNYYWKRMEATNLVCTQAYSQTKLK